VAPALVIDLGTRRRWPPSGIAAAVAASLRVVYVPVRNLLGDGVRFGLDDVVVGLPLTWLAAFLAFVLAGGVRRSWPGRAAATPAPALAFALALGMLAAPALAHDPGQGDLAGTVAFTVTVAGERARVLVELPPAACAQTEPVALVVRRAGRVLQADLDKRGCRLEGVADLPERGRSAPIIFTPSCASWPTGRPSPSPTTSAPPLTGVRIPRCIGTRVTSSSTRRESRKEP